MAEYIDKNGNPVKKPYNEMNVGEKLDSIARNKVYSMGAAINAIRANGDKPFYEKPMSAKEILDTMPFNALTGQPFNKADEIQLRLEAQAKGYNDLRFITENEAKLIDPNAKLKEYPVMENDKTQARDEQGNPVFRKENGIVTDKLQTHTYRQNKEGKVVTTKDPKTKKDIPVLDKLQEPKVYKIPLYHVSQFENLKLSKDLPQLDKEAVAQRQDKYLNSARQISYASIDRLQSQKMNQSACIQMKKFMDCIAKGLNFSGKEQTQYQQKQQAPQEKTQEKTPKKKNASRDMTI